MKASLNNNRKGRLEHQPLGSWFKSLLCGLSYKIRVNTFSLLTAGSFAILGAHVPGTDLDSRTITMKGQFRVPKTRQTRKSVVLVQRGKDCDSGRVFWSREGGCQAKGPCIPTTSPRSLLPTSLPLPTLLKLPPAAITLLPHCSYIQHHAQRGHLYSSR